jgi:UDP-GlcNAc:undecaprenyl-phosphate/decaprenyl-phosphate GlcNAc-1-phosphate transferase
VTAAGFGLVALVVTTVSWLVLRPVFDSPRLIRRNYRDASVIGGAGLVSAMVGAGVCAVAGASVDELDEGAVVALSIAGFGVIGFIDDVWAASSGGGFGGHMRTLVADRRMTTGVFKAAMGAVVGLVTAAVLADFAPVATIRDGLLIALGANLANLFDRAPLRSSKIAGAATIALAMSAGVNSIYAVVCVGAVAGLAWFEIREYLMLGDAGANALGAGVAISAVVGLSPGTRWVVLAALVALNLLSEVVSFTLVIDNVAPLRYLDRMASRYR